MILYIVRGIPGSGKSDIAKILSSEHCYSATDYFYNKSGVFKYDGSKLDKAHKTCFKNVQQAMFSGAEVIVVHNTFVHKWEYEIYIDIATKLGYEIREIICKGDSGNKYSIPSEKIRRMIKEFEWV